MTKAAKNSRDKDDYSETAWESESRSGVTQIFISLRAENFWDEKLIWRNKFCDY